MIITLKKSAPITKINELIKQIEAQGISINLIKGTNYNILGLVGDTSLLDANAIAANEFVDNVQRIAAPYKLANRMFHPENSIIDVDGVLVGGNKIVMIAGPCSVENEDMMVNIAKEVHAAGASMMRGGAYKPRTSPYAFQGLGKVGLDYMNEAKKATGMPVVSELMSADKLDEFIANVDVIQIGARNMQNYELLKAVGKCNKPILLKRGFANTIEEWIMAAEYIMAAGNPNVIFCERGIRTFEKYTRNTLDLSVIPIIKQRTHLPIIIDPSHATGDYSLVEPISLAAIAAGADGLIIEVHDCPAMAKSDGAQSLKPERYAQLVSKCRKIAEVVGREI